ncbi:hypothetical protein [Vibrio atlanticus]|uniref:hypothetical protein n=1 Tax=Vibrio atlanticus TaxID=693153 RepID=UPI0035546240
MFEVIKAYPLIFIFTVILPLGGGLVGSYLGLDSLKSRLEDDLHKEKLERSLGSIDESLAPITTQLKTIQRYELALSKYDQKDEVLNAVLSQYRNMQTALNNFHSLQSGNSEIEKGQLADNILGVITSNLVPVQEAPQLPHNPLIIGLGLNKYKVIFAVPMRIAPRLDFGMLPKNVTSHVTEATKFGFTVEFIGTNEPLPFGFSADAEL